MIRRIEAWRDLPPEARGASVALGNFDGLHRGHQAVIAEARRAADRLSAPCGVISFEPHPRKWFQPQAEPFRVMGPRQFARALEALGVERLYALPFDADMAAMSDEDFAREVLSEGLGVRHVAAGFDVTFGRDRTGDGEVLEAYGRRYGFGVSICPRMADLEDVKFSSTAVRQAVRAGDPRRAAEILGHPFAIEGVVAQGDQRGRTLGFPTANLSLSDYVRPAFGVYATRVRLEDGRVFDGVANIGRRPTVKGQDERLEVHLFDFEGDLYGQTLEVALVGFLRPEQTFAGLEALKVRISHDADAARALLRREPAAG